MSPAGARNPQPESRIASGTWVSVGLLALLVLFALLPGTPTSVRIASVLVGALLGRRVWRDLAEVRSDRQGPPRGGRARGEGR